MRSLYRSECYLNNQIVSTKNYQILRTNSQSRPRAGADFYETASDLIKW